MVETISNSDNAKVNLILDAAQKRFGYYGLAKTTMTEIAQDVGLSKASLYYYFSDKDSLFRAVVKREQERFIEEMKVMIHAKNQASNKLLKYVDNRHEYFLKVFLNLGKLKMSYETVKPLLGDLIEAFFQSEVKLVSEILNEGIEQGEFEKINVPMHADIFIAMMNGLRKLTLRPDDSYLVEQSDLDLIEQRIKNLGKIFINGILKK